MQPETRLNHKHKAIPTKALTFSIVGFATPTPAKSEPAEGIYRPKINLVP